MTTWNVRNNNQKKNIEKRILCQPQTFGMQSREDLTIVTIHTEAGESRFIEVLAEAIMEKVFYETAYKYMNDIGYTEEFSQSYITLDLLNEVFKSPWFDRLTFKVEDNLNSVKPDEDGQLTFDLEAFIRFQTHQLRREIEGFMQLGDREVKEQLISMTLNPMVTVLKEEPELAEKERAEGIEPLKVELYREDDDITVQMHDDWAYLASEMENSFLDVMNQRVYKEDSEMYAEYMEGVIFTFLALIFPIHSFVLEEEEHELRLTLQNTLESFGMTTKVVTYDCVGD